MKPTGPNSPIKDYAHRLNQVRVLLADSDREILYIIRDMLHGFGFRNISTVTDGAEALRAMKKQHFDLAITEWEVGQIDGVSMIRYLRTAPDAGFRYKPVIMLTGHSEEREVIAARDAGVSEYLVKPFTAKSLVQRIRLVVDQPRNFVWSPTFKGPDRRHVGEPPAGIEDRRIAETQNLVRKEIAQMMKEDQVRIIKAEYELKEKIGRDVSLDQIFTEERINAAQEVIFDGAKEFLNWFANDCKTLQAECRKLPQGENIAEVLGNIEDAAFSIKARAGTFGYDCASLVANSLHQFTRRHPNFASEHLLVYEKHTESLLTILQNNISGLGGEIGQELLHRLNQLTKKF